MLSVNLWMTAPLGTVADALCGPVLAACVAVVEGVICRGTEVGGPRGAWTRGEVTGRAAASGRLRCNASPLPYTSPVAYILAFLAVDETRLAASACADEGAAG